MTNQSNIVVIPHRGEQRYRNGTSARAVRELLDDEWIVETPPLKKEKFLAEIRQRNEAFRLSHYLRRGDGYRNMLKVKRGDWQEDITDMENIWLDVLEK